MQITLSWSSVIGLAGGIAALIALLGYLFKGYDFVKRQKKQDEILRSTQTELALLTFGVLACLKGLHEQGANGPVTEAINKIEKHMNEAAHSQLKGD